MPDPDPSPEADPQDRTPADTASQPPTEDEATAVARLDPGMAAILKAGAAPPTDDVAEMRRHALASKAEMNAAAAEKVAVETIEVAGADGPIPCLVVGKKHRNSLVHIHGGGWAAGSPQTHLSLLAALSEATGRTVYAPHPRQAPEHPYPAPVLDTLAAIRALKPYHFFDYHLSGDSAGAHLALAALLAAQREGDPLKPNSLTLIYGCFRKRFDTASHTMFGDGSVGLSTDRMRLFWDWFDPQGAADLENATFQDMPSTLLLAADCDVLRDDTFWLFERMCAAGQTCQMHMSSGMAHGFVHHQDALRPARLAIEFAASFMASHGREFYDWEVFPPL